MPIVGVRLTAGRLLAVSILLTAASIMLLRFSRYAFSLAPMP
jgi:hypothetical protein